MLFAWMGYWAFKQIRAMFAYHRELRALAGDTGSVGVTIGDGAGVGTIEEEEEHAEEQPDEEDEDYAFIQRPVANDGAQKTDDARLKKAISACFEGFGRRAVLYAT